MTDNDKTGDQLASSIRRTKVSASKKSAAKKKATAAPAQPAPAKKVAPQSKAKAVQPSKRQTRQTPVYQASQRVWPD